MEALRGWKKEIDKVKAICPMWVFLNLYCSGPDRGSEEKGFQGSRDNDSEQGGSPTGCLGKTPL
eukprot:802132-Amorphochlora_amoeboformis.AAC.1